ncbi:20254_t:CDS:2 [Racocetra persica]|uniref:20254_t:CDS:1 n=1 Tax=Racocetra persica TaxID=160502 RepID=A0ACA9KI58_9GLOM|nr:20254_t:CDS:2 [Racocetra persica]
MVPIKKSGMRLHPYKKVITRVISLPLTNKEIVGSMHKALLVPQNNSKPEHSKCLKPIYPIQLHKLNENLDEVKSELKKQKNEQDNELLAQSMDIKSAEIIGAEKTAIFNENENTVTKITSEIQEQTTTQNRLNSREVNDKLFSV